MLASLRSWSSHLCENRWWVPTLSELTPTTSVSASGEDLTALPKACASAVQAGVKSFG